MQHNNTIFMDFEFGDTTSRWVRLVAACTVYQGEIKTWDLRGDYTSQGRKDLRHYLDTCPANIICGYNVDAEIRALHSLYRSLTFARQRHYICLFREYKNLANRSLELNAGKVMDKDGKISMVSLPEARFTKYGKNTGLISALYKLVGVEDTQHIAHKARLTQIIVKYPEFVDRYMDEILAYVEMDTAYLPDLLTKIYATYKARLANYPDYLAKVPDDMLRRGRYAEIIARRTAQGYHVNVEGLRKVCDGAEEILNGIAESILVKWPSRKTFSMGRDGKYHFHPQVVRDAILASPPRIRKKFKLSEKTQQISLETDTFAKLYRNRHDLDPNDYLQQVYKYLYHRSQLKGLTFAEGNWGGRKTFGDYFDEKEGVVRPYFNDFGAQTSRTQPAANGYLLLKPAWLRQLVIPPPNQVMVYGDYGKQEFLELAVLSQDKKMIDAYATGDPYVAFGEMAGILRKGLKQSDPVQFELLRDACKRTILGWQYGVQSETLSDMLSAETGVEWTQFRAQELLHKIAATFPTAVKWLDRQYLDYRRKKFLRLPDGWYMWEGNASKLSVKNFPVQGLGGTIMRFFELLMFEQGHTIPLTLHDSFIAYHRAQNPNYLLEFVREFLSTMRKAFIAATNNAPGSDLITVDCKIIGNIDSTNMPETIKVDGKLFDLSYSKLYQDKRASNSIKELEKYLT